MNVFMQAGKILFPAVLALGLAGCMAGPDFRAPDAPEISRYTPETLPQKTASAPVNAGAEQQFLPGEDIPAQWWTLFGSPSLDSVLRQALLNNPTLAAAEATLRQAGEILTARTGAELFPAVDTDASVERQKISGTLFGQPDATVRPFTIYNASVRFSYMLDLFGGARRELEALLAEVDLRRYQLEAAYLTISSNIVTAAIREASLRAEMQAMQEIVAAQEEQLRVIEQQFQLGAVAMPDVLAMRAELAQTRALLPPLEKDLSGIRHQIAVLSGKFPVEAGTLPAFDLRELHLPRELPVSLPSSLVRTRPDIQAAEAVLHAAIARIGAATANLYPQITLTGAYGSSSVSPGDLFSNGSAVWSLGAGLLQPLFRGGELSAEMRAAAAGYDQAAAEYRSTVLSAFQNVADVLRALDADARALDAQAQAEAAARESYEFTQKQLSLGAVSYLSLLNAERQYRQARISLVRAQAERFADTAALFQALGGGWWNRQAGPGPQTTDAGQQSPDHE